MPDYNSTLTSDECVKLTWCLDAYGQIRYIPNLAGNALYLSLFSLAALAQLGLAVKYKTWGYLVAMTGGIALEIVGYIGRIMLHQDIFDNNDFIIYIVGLTIGPAFFSAAIYLSISRIITIFGSELSWLKPKTITIIFVGCDLLSLILQAAGGALASTANTPTDSHAGVNIMIAGLSTQVASTAAFCLLCAHLAWSIMRHPEKLDDQYRSFRQTMRFNLYLCAIALATITILVRCTFRVAELSEGFDGSLANNEVLFMVLDGAMMIICVSCLTFAHPGIMLGALWSIGEFRWRQKKLLAPNEKSIETSKSDNSEE